MFNRSLAPAELWEVSGLDEHDQDEAKSEPDVANIAKIELFKNISSTKIYILYDESHQLPYYGKREPNLKT